MYIEIDPQASLYVLHVATFMIQKAGPEYCAYDTNHKSSRA